MYTLYIHSKDGSHKFMTSQIRSRIGYLIQTDNILVHFTRRRRRRRGVRAQANAPFCPPPQYNTCK